MTDPASVESAPVAHEEAVADPTELISSPSKMGGRLAAVTGGATGVPLAILFGLNFVDEFDRIAFATLTPEIRDAFSLSDAGIGAIGVISSVVILLLALPIGVMGDRYNRVRVAGFAAVLWGVMSVLTGVVPTVALLFAVRLLSGVGRIINEVVHPSLLADYYRPQNHPRVFQVHRLANPTSAVSGIVAGLIAAGLGWRWAFILLAIPTFVFLAFLSRLKEPRRGASVDAAAAEQAAEEAPVSFAEARRQLFAVRTLRRLWIGGFFLGIGYLAIGQFLSLFFESVYGFGPIGRGTVQVVFGAGAIVGLFVGGSLASKAAQAGHSARLATITGLSFVAFAVGLALMALAPVAALSVLFAFVLSAGVGAYQPAYYSLVGQVAPPRVRTQAYAYAIVFVGLGGFASIPLFELGETQGYRTAIVVLSAIIGLAGLIGASASRFVARDVEQAANALATQLRLREELASSGKQALLACRGVEVAYDQVQVLFGVDLEVRPGEIVALLGTNGAGKSTLLKAISGTVDPIGGAVFFDGRDITHADAVQTAKLGIVQVPGGKAVFPTLTVAEHLRAAGWLYRDDQAYLDQANEEVLTIFPRLRERISQMAGNLSGGEQQMLALGMAFIAKPKLLMIDELSLGLAPTIVEQLLGIVRRITEQGTAIILVEQSINVALTVAERAYFMEKGEVRFEGPTQELLERDDIVRSVFLQGASVATGQGGDKVQPVASRRTRVAADAPPVLEVRGLTKRFGGIRAVDDTTFTLRKGEILGLIGPNGAGKTTIFDLVSGFLTPDGGSITLDGTDVTTMAPDRRAWLGLGRSFQDARLVPSLTVAENVAIGLERHIELRDHVASALSLPGIVRSEEDVAWTVNDLVEMMNLGAYRDKFVRELSTGSRRIVDLAMCIAHDPTVLLLDEQSSGIAQRETEALGPLLERIQHETGCALLVIEHDMPLITTVSDRMIALELGHPIVEGTPDEVTTNPRVVSSYLGGDLSVINRSGATSEPDAEVVRTSTGPPSTGRRDRRAPLVAPGRKDR
ncbi:MAG TPA: MFS transporter [Acidimicrobiales bacterium]|nr:MFS transporter [Acidimicrobiales bacterium]